MNDERLLTAEEQAPFTHTDLVEYGDITVGEEVWDIEGLLKAQLAKGDKGTGEVSSPDREKEIEDFINIYMKWLKVNEELFTIRMLVKKIIALFPDKNTHCVGLENCCDLEVKIEQAKREERERIWAWGHLMCDTLEHTNILLPKEMGGGTVKINNRRRRRCVQCWGTLLNEQALKQGTISSEFAQGKHHQINSRNKGG